VGTGTGLGACSSWFSCRYLFGRGRPRSMKSGDLSGRSERIASRSAAFAKSHSSPAEAESRGTRWPFPGARVGPRAGLLGPARRHKRRAPAPRSALGRQRRALEPPRSAPRCSGKRSRGCPGASRHGPTSRMEATYTQRTRTRTPRSPAPTRSLRRHAWVHGAVLPHGSVDINQ
jgi:hypothetical protein